LASFDAEPLPILAAGKEQRIPWRAEFLWVYAFGPSYPMVYLYLTVTASDIHRRSLDTIYELTIAKSKARDNLTVGRRQVVVTGGWRLGLRGVRGRLARRVRRLIRK